MPEFIASDPGSSFPSQNILFNSASGLTGQQLQKNQLALQGAQLDLTAADHEQVARLSAALLNEPDLGKRADLYSRGVGMLQSQNLAKYAPPTLPDESTLRMLAAQGVSSEKQYEYGAGRTAAQGALGALGIGSTGTGTPAGGGGDFAAKLTTAESGGNPSVINKQGYTGQFQFGKQRLSELGYYTPAPGEDMKDNTKWAGKVSVPGFNVTDQASFAANPAAQQAVFNTHLGDIDKAIDQMPNAGKFDRNGLRAVAHLGGISGMERFASSGGVYDPADANGTRLSSYYQRFSGGGTQTAAAPTGGVAARTGGTDTAGPGAGPVAPPGSTAAPDAKWDLPGAPAPDQPPAPPAATTAPAATTPTPAPQVPLEPVLQLLPSGLTAQQEAAAKVAFAQPMTPAAATALTAHYQQLAANNIAANHTAGQTNFERQHQAQADAQAQQEKALADARTAEQLRLSQVTSQREQDAAAALAEQRRVENERAAQKAAFEKEQATKPQQSKSDEADAERVLMAIGPKVRAGEPLTEAEADQYDVARRRYARGPVQQVPDGKGGTITAFVGQDVPDRFPPLPGQKEYAGLKPIPGTEKQPDFAPANATTAMLDIAEGQRKIVRTLAELGKHPGGVGLVAGGLPPIMSNWTNPQGVQLRADVGDVKSHIYHTLSGSAVTAIEEPRLQRFAPQETDTPEALKAKLQRMLDLNRETQLDHYRAFGPESGGRRNPAVEDAILATIPQAALDHLKENPSTTKDFDQMYGRGAAKLALSNG
jgi:hypothetical protein